MAYSQARERTESTLEGLDSAGAATLGAELVAVVRLLEGNYPLRRALGDTSTKPQDRSELVRRVFGSGLSEATVALLAEVVALTLEGPSGLLAALTDLSAEALLASADKDGHLDDVEDELFRFARTLDREPQLSLALSNPGLPQDRKTGLLGRLLEGKAQPATLAIIDAAVASPAGRSLERRLERLSALAAARRNRLVAVVRVARALDDGQTERLRSALSRVYGREIHLQVDIDPSVLGGVVVKVGDEVLDGSVARRFDQARARL